ncbi:MAG: hypothetical protein ACM3UO_00235 [Bacillota bacterium]
MTKYALKTREIDLGKDGSKWSHGWIPLNAAAAALKAHRGSGGGNVTAIAFHGPKGTAVIKRNSSGGHDVQHLYTAPSGKTTMRPRKSFKTEDEALAHAHRAVGGPTRMTASKGSGHVDIAPVAVDAAGIHQMTPGTRIHVTAAHSGNGHDHHYVVKDIGGRRKVLSAKDENHEGHLSTAMTPEEFERRHSGGTGFDFKVAEPKPGHEETKPEMTPDQHKTAISNLREDKTHTVGDTTISIKRGPSGRPMKRQGPFASGPTTVYSLKHKNGREGEAVGREAAFTQANLLNKREAARAARAAAKPEGDALFKDMSDEELKKQIANTRDTFAGGSPRYPGTNAALGQRLQRMKAELERRQSAK